jgi:hypothetical protein
MKSGLERHHQIGRRVKRTLCLHSDLKEAKGLDELN